MTDGRGRLDTWWPLVVVTLLVVATGAVGAVFLQTDAQTQPSGDTILENVEQRYESAETVVGAATVVVENDTERRTATVEYVATGDNDSRVTVTDEGDRTFVVGTNGSVAWSYQPATGITRTYDNETKVEQMKARYDREYADRLQRFEGNLTVTRTGTETVDGQDAYVLDVTSENESVTASGTLWVDREDWTVLKSQLVTDNGTVTVTATDTRFDVSVADATFRPPDETGRLVDGADRERYDDFAAAQSATDLTLPDLRGTYEFEGTVVASHDGTTTATAIYDTDAGEVYVGVTNDDNAERRSVGDGETETIEGTEVTVTSGQGGSVVYWQDGETTTAVVTRGPPETAHDVVATILQDGR